MSHSQTNTLPDYLGHQGPPEWLETGRGARQLHWWLWWLLETWILTKSLLEGVFHCWGLEAQDVRWEGGGCICLWVKEREARSWVCLPFCFNMDPSKPAYFYLLWGKGLLLLLFEIQYQVWKRCSSVLSWEYLSCYLVVLQMHKREKGGASHGHLSDHKSIGETKMLSFTRERVTPQLGMWRKIEESNPSGSSFVRMLQPEVGQQQRTWMFWMEMVLVWCKLDMVLQIQ